MPESIFIVDCEKHSLKFFNQSFKNLFSLQQIRKWSKTVKEKLFYRENTGPLMTFGGFDAEENVESLYGNINLKTIVNHLIDSEDLKMKVEKPEGWTFQQVFAKIIPIFFANENCALIVLEKLEDTLIQRVAIQPERQHQASTPKTTSNLENFLHASFRQTSKFLDKIFKNITLLQPNISSSDNFVYLQAIALNTSFLKFFIQSDYDLNCIKNNVFTLKPTKMDLQVSFDQVVELMHDQL